MVFLTHKKYILKITKIMNMRIRFSFLLLIVIFFSCNNTSEKEEAIPKAPFGFVNTESAMGAKLNDENSAQWVFNEMMCYKYLDELGNNGTFEIYYDKATGALFIATGESIPMVEGVFVHPKGNYSILAVDENGKKKSFTYQNSKDHYVLLSDEEGIQYPKDHPYIDYRLNEGESLVYRDELKGSADFIKSALYTVTYERTGDYMNLYLSGDFPKLNARLLYGLSQLPDDTGLFFKRFSELWNISSLQWPTLISGKNYSIEMTCFSLTNYHLNLDDFKESR